MLIDLWDKYSSPAHCSGSRAPELCLWLRRHGRQVECGGRTELCYRTPVLLHQAVVPDFDRCFLPSYTAAVRPVAYLHLAYEPRFAAAYENVIPHCRHVYGTSPLICQEIAERYGVPTSEWPMAASAISSWPPVQPSPCAWFEKPVLLYAGRRAYARIHLWLNRLAEVFEGRAQVVVLQAEPSIPPTDTPTHPLILEYRGLHHGSFDHWLYYAAVGLDLACRPDQPWANCKHVDYLAAGLPVVAERHTHQNSLLDQPAAAAISRQLDFDQFDQYVGAVEALLETPATLRQAACDWIAGHHTWRQRAADLHAVLGDD